MAVEGTSDVTFGQADAQEEAPLTSDIGLRRQHSSDKLETELRSVEERRVLMDTMEKAEHHMKALHTHITTCEKILLKMQGALGGFLSSLSPISQELQSLQEQSTCLDLQLQYDTTVAMEHTSAALDRLSLPSSVFHHVFNSPVTEPAFMTQLHILDEMSKFLKQQQQTFKADVEDLVSKLRMRAVSKIREHFLQKIRQCCEPCSNLHNLQNTLIQHKFFFEFLLQHDRAVAVEVRDEYVDTMGQVYLSYFQTYTKQLWQLQVCRDDGQESRETADLVVAAEDDVRGGVGRTSADGGNGGFLEEGRATTSSQPNSVFALANRDVVLSPEGLAEDIIVPHNAVREGKKFQFEELFRSQQYALLNNCCWEMAFLSQFFLVTDDDLLKLFEAVLCNAMQLVQKEVCSVVVGSFDSVGLCVCLHLCHQLKLLCHKRTVLSLDAHWETLNDTLYQRFAYVLRLNTQSLQGCDVTKFTSVDVVRPHYVCRRVSEVCGAIASLEQRFPIGGTTKVLGVALQRELELMLLRLSGHHFPRNRMQQLVFLINNYDMVLAVLTREKASSESSESRRLREMLAHCTAEYIREILRRSEFCSLLTYAQQAQRLLDAGDILGLRETEGTAVNVARAFSNSWCSGVERLNNEVMRCFSNIRTGSGVMQRALEALITAHQTLNLALEGIFSASNGRQQFLMRSLSESRN